jgi:hypothetical protein
MASVQPDIFNLVGFADSVRTGQMGDILKRLAPEYAKLIMVLSRPELDSNACSKASALRTAPWALIEVNTEGVRGPSPFYQNSKHHFSVLDMLQSYDWLQILESIVPQMTICENALPYLLDKDTRTVRLNLLYFVGKPLKAVRSVLLGSFD